MRTSSPKDWQAESDAHTLISAQKIATDAKRLGKAKHAVAKIEAEAQATLSNAAAVKGRTGGKAKAVPPGPRAEALAVSKRWQPGRARRRRM